MKLFYVLALVPFFLFADDKPQTLIVQLRKGEVVPFTLNLKSALFELSSHDPLFCLKCQDDMWLKLENGKPSFSTDGVIWTECGSAFEGRAAVALHMKSDIPSGSVDIDLQGKR